MKKYPSFNNKKSFANESSVINSIREKFNDELKKLEIILDDKEIEANLSLFSESVIKHNLSINFIKVNWLNLIDEDNSKVVKSFFETIIEK